MITGINRYIVGCKDNFHERDRKGRFRINRYIVGCKEGNFITKAAYEH